MLKTMEQRRAGSVGQYRTIYLSLVDLGAVGRVVGRSVSWSRGGWRYI